MEYEVRQATMLDTEFIITLLEDICSLHHEGRDDIFKNSGSKYNYQDLAELFEREDIFIDICTDNEDNRLGYIFQVLKTTDEDNCRYAQRVLYIDDLCVDSSRRSKGVGAILMESAKKLAERLGCSRIELNVWDFNKKAISFYEQLGYTPQRHIYELKVERPDQN